jgi:predicted anti-sigma-YlaC factor YlaD
MENETKRIGPACQQYEVLLDDYLGGQLAAASARRAEEHLESCSSCRSAFDAAREGARLFQVAGFVLEGSAAPGPAFSRVVMARVGVEKERRAAERLSYWQPFVSFAWRFAATAMLALMLLLTYAVRGRGRTREVVGPIGQQSALVDVFSPDPTRTPANQDEVLIMVAESARGGR